MDPAARWCLSGLISAPVVKCREKLNNYDDFLKQTCFIWTVEVKQAVEDVLLKRVSLTLTFLKFNESFQKHSLTTNQMI